MHCTNRTAYINLVCIHLKINVVPLAFTVYIVVQNVQFVHCALYKSYSLYKHCVRALRNKCSPFTVYIVAQNVQFVHCTAYTVKIVQFIYSMHLVCVNLKLNVVPLLFTL